MAVWKTFENLGSPFPHVKPFGVHKMNYIKFGNNASLAQKAALLTNHLAGELIRFCFMSSPFFLLYPCGKCTNRVDVSRHTRRYRNFIMNTKGDTHQLDTKRRKVRAFPLPTKPF